MGRRTVELSPPARDDLEDIWRFSKGNWGAARADQYVAALNTGFARLAETPEIGPERREITPPVRLWRAESHLLIYRFDVTALRILRIAHHRRNWIRLLERSE